MAGKKGGRAAIRESIETAETARLVAPPAPPAEEQVIRTSGGRLVLRPEGLMKLSDEGPGVRVAGHFEVLSQTRDDEAQAWGLMIRFTDPDGVPRREVIRRDLFAGDGGELRSLLAKRGLYVNPAHNVRGLLAEYLARVTSDKRVRVVNRTGWHTINGKRIFVLPEKWFGSAGVDVFYQAASTGEASLYNSGGTLADWRNQVSEPCAGNSRLVLAVSAAFAGPLLEILGEDGGGIHFRGASRIGKTTALRVAASVWGGDGVSGAAGYIRQWRATDNAMESLALAQSDTLLPLDELGQADARTVGETAYLLASGQGKARSDRGGSLRAPIRFRSLFLSTGEMSLADKIQEAGGSRRIKAGQEVRLLEVPADAGKHLGLFDTLHGAADAEAFIQEIRSATIRNYGTAAAAFLSHLVRDLEVDPEFAVAKRDWISDLVAQFLAAAGVAGEAGGQVRSVARRFALMAVAGEMATISDITGWESNEATEAAKRCFLAWLKDRGTSGAREDEQAVVQLRDFLLTHGDARFSEWRVPADEARPVGEAEGDARSDEERAGPAPERFRTMLRAGWRKWEAHDDAEPRATPLRAWTYYVNAAGMREALAGLDFKQATESLAVRGFLERGTDGRNSRSLSPPGHPKLRLYCVKPAIFAAE